MQELEGQRKGTKKYYYDGYFYHADPRYDDEAYICTYRFRQWQCPVTAKVDLNNKLTVSGEHGHSATPLEEYTRFEEFKKKLKEQARDTDIPPNTILENLKKQYSDVAHLILDTSAKMHIIRERNKHRTHLPGNLKEFGDMLEDFESVQGIFKGQVVISETSNAVLFASSAMIKRLEECEDIYVDSDFTRVPSKLGSKQLLILQIRKRHVWLPCIYVFCSEKSEQLYEGIWKFILDRIPGLKTNVKSIMMSFERALVKSVKNTMPTVMVRCCWFHYARTISSHWDTLGLKKVTSLPVQNVLDLARGLSLLPADKFHAAIQFLKEKAAQLEPEYSESVNEFIRYLQSQWLRIAEMVSVWRSQDRVINMCVSFHGRLLERFGSNPKMNAFVEKLTKFIEEIDADWQNLEDVNSITNKRYKQASVDSYINNNQWLVFSENISVGEFLTRMTSKNIKKFIELKLYSPVYVKNLNSNEIASPDEIISLLEYIPKPEITYSTNENSPPTVKRPVVVLRNLNSMLEDTNEQVPRVNTRVTIKNAKVINETIEPVVNETNEAVMNVTNEPAINRDENESGFVELARQLINEIQTSTPYIGQEREHVLQALVPVQPTVMEEKEEEEENNTSAIVPSVAEPATPSPPRRITRFNRARKLAIQRAAAKRKLQTKPEEKSRGVADPSLEIAIKKGKGKDKSIELSIFLK